MPQYYVYTGRGRGCAQGAAAGLCLCGKADGWVGSDVYNTLSIAVTMVTITTLALFHMISPALTISKPDRTAFPQVTVAAAAVPHQGGQQTLPSAGTDSAQSFHHLTVTRLLFVVDATD